MTQTPLDEGSLPIASTWRLGSHLAPRSSGWIGGASTKQGERGAGCHFATSLFLCLESDYQMLLLGNMASSDAGCSGGSRGWQLGINHLWAQHIFISFHFCCLCTYETSPFHFFILDPYTESF